MVQMVVVSSSSSTYDLQRGESDWVSELQENESRHLAHSVHTVKDRKWFLVLDLVTCI